MGTEKGLLRPCGGARGGGNDEGAGRRPMQPRNERNAAGNRRRVRKLCGKGVFRQLAAIRPFTVGRASCGPRHRLVEGRAVLARKSSRTQAWEEFREVVRPGRR